MSYYRSPSRERYHPLDPDRRDSVTTVRDVKTNELVKCDACGDVLEVLYPEAQGYADGTRFPRCADCNGDPRVDRILRPDAIDVRVRRERRLADAAAEPTRPLFPLQPLIAKRSPGGTP